MTSPRLAAAAASTRKEADVRAARLDPLAQAYKDKFGLSDDGARVQALLNRFAAGAGPDWKQTPIGPDAILIERADGDA
jgi:hypothetical protein